MQKLLIIFIVCIFCVSCGKKSDPVYKVKYDSKKTAKII